MGLRPSFYWVLAVAASMLACNPSIGDSCRLHSDCSQTGDRLCEPTFPGGYCTIFNCEPGSCPGDSVCVAYYSTPTSDLTCSDPTERRFQRTFCMKNCSSNSECRTNYECIDLGAPKNAFAAVVVERGDYNAQVCTRPLPAATAPESTEVCSSPMDASFPQPPSYVTPESDAAPESGAAPGDGAVVDAAPLPLKDAATPPTDALAADARSTP